MATFDENPVSTYLCGATRTKPCQNCGKPVEVSPGNGTWTSSGVTCLTKTEFSIVAPCHHCGNINYYINFIKKTDLKKSDGVQEV